MTDKSQGLLSPGHEPLVTQVVASVNPHTVLGKFVCYCECGWRSRRQNDRAAVVYYHRRHVEAVSLRRIS